MEFVLSVRIYMYEVVIGMTYWLLKFTCFVILDIYTVVGFSAWPLAIYIFLKFEMSIE